MDIHCYEQDHGFVLERFKNGEFDYVDSASEVEETEFFRFIQAKKYLTALVSSVIVAIPLLTAVLVGAAPVAGGLA